MRDTHVASSVVDVLRVATDGGARELLRVVLDKAPGAAGGCAVVGRCGRRLGLLTSLAKLWMILFTRQARRGRWLPQKCIAETERVGRVSGKRDGVPAVGPDLSVVGWESTERLGV